MKAVFAALFSVLLACAATAQGNSGLDNPKVPLAPSNTKQSADTVLDSTGIPGARDNAAESSPVSGQRTGSAIKVGSAISMQLSSSVDSGSFKNGDAVHGTLTAPVRTTAGVVLPAGTRIDGTVVSAAKAGTVESGGILSIQLTRVGGVPVVTDVVDFNGKEGHKDVADSAPDKGTEAVARAGSTLNFHVLENGVVPGVIPGARLDGGKAGALPAAGAANTGPGVNQTPVNGGSSPVGTAAPGGNPKQ